VDDDAAPDANDLDGPELWAVTDNVNQSKGDKDPAEFQPPGTSPATGRALAESSQ
jgi:hypothetical protein